MYGPVRLGTADYYAPSKSVGIDLYKGDLAVAPGTYTGSESEYKVGEPPAGGGHPVDGVTVGGRSEGAAQKGTEKKPDIKAGYGVVEEHGGYPLGADGSQTQSRF